MTHDSLDRAYARGERFFDEELFAESLNVPEADRAEVIERQTQLLHERDTWRNHVANSDERMHERIDAALASGPIAFQAQLTSEANRLPEDQRDAFMLHQMRLAHRRKWRTVPPSSEVDDRDIPIREPPAGLAPPPGIQRDDGPLMRHSHCHQAALRPCPPLCLFNRPILGAFLRLQTTSFLHAILLKISLLGIISRLPSLSSCWETLLSSRRLNNPAVPLHPHSPTRGVLNPALMCPVLELPLQLVLVMMPRSALLPCATLHALPSHSMFNHPMNTILMTACLHSVMVRPTRISSLALIRLIELDTNAGSMKLMIATIRQKDTMPIDSIL